jgi:type I restriction enzyme S subunit
VTPGYKKTEIGFIPVDWEIASIGEVAAIRVARDLQEDKFSAVADATYRFPVYSNTVANDGLYGFYSIPEYEGDSVTVVGRGVGLGTAFAKTGGYGAIGRLLVLLPSEQVDARFLATFVNQSVRVFVETGGIPQLTGIQFSKYKIAVPPLSEQRAIGTALGDVDALLGGLDRLIAKKRDLKQAAMQQLLTGRTRLAGFQGEWENVDFGDIAIIRNVKVISSSAPAGTQCVELDAIGQGTGQLLGSIDATGSSSKYSFKKGDVLFGRLRAYLRKYWLASFDGICSTEIWPLIPRDERLCSGYLHLLVQTNGFVDAAGISYGTHMPRSDWSVLSKFTVLLPSRTEQTAITAVLSDMDAELTALESRRAKTRALKQAMMQELLTGKTRLV